MTSPFPAPCTCGGDPDVTPEMRTETGQHLVGCPQLNVEPEPVTEPVNSAADDKPKCGAKRKQQPEGQTDAKCTRPAGWGTDHVGSGRCKLHGGNTPNGKKHAGKQIAKKARDTFGLPVEIDPAQALLEEVWRTQGHVIWLGLQVQQLKTKNVAWGVTKIKTGGEDYGTTQEAKVNAFVALYQEERKHLVRVTSEAIKAGVEEKRLTLETHRAELVVNMLGSIFDDLELTDEQATKLEELVPRALTAIAALEGTK